MQIFVDPDLCISCGDCIEVCPKVFDWDEEGLSYAIVDEVPEELQGCAHESVEICPTEAIKETSLP